ncbi:DEAD/DEAH box helicase family protein [Streptococcus danieliae]|uniref:DEAD/DEAH box helicase family protein n=1 Tax=Streptococcus danieliae TaxID=747656 RepID=A0A7Z0LCR0_9STRE|nr:DEAD/DEAH box helicase family protein [Streptococcus danieliae]MBF0717061.1 DEAD/DEAH box helicase family protein [Streptococcus danieliae]NYS48991.1 DEAD/DEAH box helicase family protein [Streptococcus danieliae]
MKLQFKQQDFQIEAVDAIADIFQGQAKRDGFRYLMDIGRSQQVTLDVGQDALRNAPIELSEDTIKEQVTQIQLKHHLKPSSKLALERIGQRIAYNFTIEMETGTGKTYTYIRTIMELNKRYGWLKFIIVVPSVAIREGVLKSFQMMDDHFQMEYGKKPRYFVYNSSRLRDLDTFANSSDIRVMIINSQAFNAKGKDARRIHMEQESFAWRKPIDVIAAMNPILIIDEPQSVEGKQTKERLKDFHPLFTLRYSATHKEDYDMVYRLDAMDAYNRKLVKKIAVKAIEQTTTMGTQGYLYLQEIVPQRTGAPKARIEFEVRGKTGIRRKTKLVREPFDLYIESGELEVYRGWTLSGFDARDNKLQIGPTRELYAGEVMGELNEASLRRIQIRETIKSHLETEERLYNKKIKVLSLFFIDEVAKYKCYDDQHQASNGEYAQIFEEEYEAQVQALLGDPNRHGTNFWHYLNRYQSAKDVHAGYFSVDKVKKSDKTIFVDYKSASEKRAQQSNDSDAYDLIMKDKERLLSFEEPVRFLFSHSALKEGWDNPNVFQICTLKQSSAETRKRQEIGRGMRLAVDQNGVRQDKELLGNSVHDINKLTVIANESYDDFARGLQEELREVLANRPSKVEIGLFVGKVLVNETGAKLQVTPEVARAIQFELIRQDYIDDTGQLTPQFFEAKEERELLFTSKVQGFEGQVLELLESIYTSRNYSIENAYNTTVELGKEVNDENLGKEEFLKLWNTIHHKTTYQVDFDENELIKKAVKAVNEKLVVKKVTFQITEAAADRMDQELGLDLKIASNGKEMEHVEMLPVEVQYDLLGEVAEKTGLTRKTIAGILSQIAPYQFAKFKQNPEEFIQKVSILINEQKSAQIVDHIQYKVLEDCYDTNLFYDNSETARPSDNHVLESDKSIYHYVKVDSEIEKNFQYELEFQDDVKVYVKLPRAFKIPTPLGNYNPDWAIAFREGSVKHIYFVAETKGSMSSLQLKPAEKAKIDCAKAHFKALKDKGNIDSNYVYGVVETYADLLAIVQK